MIATLPDNFFIVFSCRGGATSSPCGMLRPYNYI
jgi:hypothetical protein